MQIIDYVIIGLVSLGALIGLWKGFFKTLISFFGWFVSFIIAIFLTKMVVGALMDVQFIKDFVLGSSGTSLLTLISGILPQDLGSGSAVDAILKPLIDLANTNQGLWEGATDIRMATALLLTNAAFSVIVCLGLFLGIRIVLLLVTMIANHLTSGKFMGAVNRLLGFVLGAVKGSFTVCVLLVIMCFMMPLGFMAPVKAHIDSSVLAKPVSEFVFKYTNKFLAGDKDILNDLLIDAGFKKYEMTEMDKALNAKLSGMRLDFGVTAAEGATPTWDYSGLGDYSGELDKIFVYFDNAAAVVAKGKVGAGDVVALAKELATGGKVFNSLTSIKVAAVSLKASVGKPDYADKKVALQTALDSFNPALRAALFDTWAGVVDFKAAPAKEEVKATNHVFQLNSAACLAL